MGKNGEEAQVMNAESYRIAKKALFDSLKEESSTDLARSVATLGMQLCRQDVWMAVDQVTPGHRTRVLGCAMLGLLQTIRDLLAEQTE